MQVNSGSVHSESFSLSVYQNAQNYIDITLRNDLLPTQSDQWVCGVSSLQVPLDDTRYLDESFPTLFNLRRLRHNVLFTPANTHFYQEPQLFPAHVVTDIVGGDPVNIRTYTEEAKKPGNQETQKPRNQ